MRLKTAVSRLSLLLLSTLASLGLFEVILRTSVGRYEEAASGIYLEDVFRIKSRKPGYATTREHPDTGRRHPVVYNALAMRQHREIAPSKAEGELRIGIFGDSFTENLNLDAPYGYTEVLDYLLNLHFGRFTVLNFGIVGYGVDQSYQYYHSSDYARHLDAVVYQFCTNDIRNLYENDLFEFGAAGELVRKPAPPRPLWMALAARLHLTYLFLETRERLRTGKWQGDRPEVARAPLEEKLVRRQMVLRQRARFHDDAGDKIQAEWEDGVSSERAAYYEDLLRAIVEEWRDEAEAEGTQFYVLLLPRPDEGRTEERLFGGFSSVNLWGELRAYGSWQRFFFAKDGHWNELGNLFAAVHLYERLAPALSLERLPRERLEEALYVYYRAFPEGWIPSIGVREVPVAAEQLQAIHARYAALDLSR
jgi:hypothetical protein